MASDDSVSNGRKSAAAPASPAQERRAARVRGDAGAMADRRMSILAVASRRFADSGFEATTVRQIADDVNLLSGSLYHHFATKEDMLHDIVREPVARFRDNVTRIAALPVDAEARLATLIRFQLEELTGNHEVHAILYGERQLFRRNPDFLYVARAKKEAYLSWQRILDDGVREGLFVADADTFLTVTTLQRLLNTGADWFTTEEAPFLDFLGTLTLESLTDFMLRFICRAVRRPERAGLPFPSPVVG